MLKTPVIVRLQAAPMGTGDVLSIFILKGVIMLLSDLHWEGPNSLEEICIWGIGPMKMLNEIFSEHVEEDEDERLTYLYYEMRNKIEGMEKTLNRFGHEMLFGNVSIENQNILKKIPGRGQKEVKELLEKLVEKYSKEVVC